MGIERGLDGAAWRGTHQRFGGLDRLRSRAPVRCPAASMSSASTTTCAPISSAPSPAMRAIASAWNVTSRATSTMRRISATADAMARIFARFGRTSPVVIHTAGQPSHDWAAREPLTDFAINATGTLNLLEACPPAFCPQAAFMFTSTNKVYGDTPNSLPLCELATRWEICRGSSALPDHGIDEGMSIDASLHSVFGASKTRCRSDGAGVWPLLRHEDASAFGPAA